jgi:hypothetical protein
MVDNFQINFSLHMCSRRLVQGFSGCGTALRPTGQRETESLMESLPSEQFKIKKSGRIT